jgi:hypothetical protein
MKNLPIKLFEKRKNIDERNPEPGGGNNLPSWAKLLSAEEIQAKASSFSQALEGTADWLDQRPNTRSFIPAVLQVTIQEKAIAKSHRTDIIKLFDEEDGKHIIGMADNNNMLVKVDDKAAITSIRQRLSSPAKHHKAIAAVEAIGRFQPAIALEETDASAALRVSLLNFQQYKLNESVCRLFEQQCEQLGVSWRKVFYTPELITYRLSGMTTEALEAVREFEAIETVAAMPLVSVGLDELIENIGETIPIRYPEDGKEYPTIGVLDSGIAKIPHLAPWILKRSFSKVPEDRKDPSHGTFVSGILEYADLLDNAFPTGQSGCWLFDATIFPDEKKDRIEEADLIDHIREAMLQNIDIKIWNLSLGTRQEADLHTFSFFGMALDQVQRETGALIIKSAGNCTNFRHGAPVSRIAKSADSVLSLVVASIAHAKGAHDLADPYHPSPFSRVGSGPAYIAKPEVTHLGGNAGVYPGTSNIVFTGVKSFSVTGGLVTNVGTSFSTPRVTAVVGGTSGSINEPFNPLFLKALAVHSAKYPDSIPLTPPERLRTMGYGIPDRIENLLFNDPYEATLVLQDTLDKGQWIQMLDFPFPPDLIVDEKYSGQIILTLATLPLFDEGQGGEYCQSNLEVRFGTHDGVRRTNRNQNPISHDSGHNLLRPLLYGAEHRKGTAGAFATERTLVQYGDKFHPIKKYAVNLEEMTDANARNFLTAPKLWYLEIEGLFRNYITNRSIQDGTPLTQEYCLILTIRDPRRKVEVYNSVTNQLNARGFQHTNVNLKNDIRVRVGLPIS